VSARRPPPAVLVVIRCGWPRCNYRLGTVQPIRNRIEGDPQAFVVTYSKKTRRRIESMIPADFSGNIPIALCGHHPPDIQVMGYPAASLKNLLALARRTGRPQELQLR
jgi:hypothetical protein